MGSFGSTLKNGKEGIKKLRNPKPWKHTQPITRAQLQQMRDDFWDTAPHYGGQKGRLLTECDPPSFHVVGNESMGRASKGAYGKIWDALRVAAGADLSLAQTIVESAGVIVSVADMTTCYDARGAKYELPKYVLSEPSNLIKES